MIPMTESEWRTCTNPPWMLSLVAARWRAAARRGGQVNFQRLRLFACACCRRLWDLLAEEDREALALIEEFARTGRGDLRAARQVRGRGRIEDDPPGADEAIRRTTSARRLASRAVWEAANARPTQAAQAFKSCANAAGSLEPVRRLRARLAELAAQADLLRDVVGNPFRAPTLDPAWLGANDGAVAKLAHAIDSERTYDRLPILGDALEEAGCADADLLAHCRSGGPHAPGCWAVDLILGRG